MDAIAYQLTPWGDADKLRDRQLPPGPGSSREAVRQNQRERLFAATVALVAEHGYEATTLVDISRLSGVSRGTFYEHFADKQECFLAALDALVDLAIGAVRRSAETAAEPDVKLRAAFGKLADLTVHQPAASHVWFIESLATGAAGAARQERAFAPLEQLIRDSIETAPEQPGLPREIVYALLGGVRRVFYRRLRSGQQQELPELAPALVDWMLGYEPPPAPLRRPRAQPNGAARAELDQADRILRAVGECVAEKGYPATSVSDVATRAATSMRTFYGHFENKDEAFLAMLDWGNVQALAAALPAFNRGPDWPHSVRNALHGFIAYAALEPALAHAGTVDVYAAGAAALDRRDGAVAGFERFLDGGYEIAPDVTPIAAEAIAGAVDALLYRALVHGGADAVNATAPIAAYVALAPFVGAQAACEIANTGGQPRRARTVDER
jgi:AcrR family transcriptional regulator